jgi:hypothetical protein
VITQYRNGSDPYAGGQHRGIDIGAAVGTPVVAAAGGEVRFAGTAGSSGLTVSVRTGDGYDTSYLHLSSIAVRAGARVAGGERLGAVGTTGERSAAPPHLHFGVREAGTRYAYIDPLSLLPPAAALPPSDAPKPAPAPAPAPLAPGPAPAPRAAPTPRLAPGPAPVLDRAPRSAPVPRGAPRSAPAPRGAPRAAPGPGGVPQPLPARGRAHRPALATPGAPRPLAAPGVHAPRGAPLPPPGSAPGSALASASAHPRSGDHLPAASSPGPGAAPASSSSGPDIGWALACAGLLLAAGILGLTGDGRNATSRARSRVAGALLPLLGRR